jgi:tape measure domain
MALTVGSVIAQFKSDLTDFKKGLSSARDDLRSFTNSTVDGMKAAEEGSKKFALALAAGATAVAGAIGYGAKIAGELEAARQGFVALLGSAEKADAVMARIKVEAATTPFELQGLVAGAQALTAITKDGNLAIDTLLDVGKAVATSGKGQNELDRVILNLQQIAATGKVTAMDIRQFQGAVPIFNDILAAAGLTVEQLQNADNAAELLFGAFKKAGQEGGITAAGFTAQAGTFNQLLSNVKDNITILSSEIIKQTGIFDALKGAMTKINDVLGNQEGIIGPIKSFFEFLQKYGIIIASAITFALIPAFAGFSGFTYGYNDSFVSFYRGRNRSRGSNYGHCLCC